MVDFSLIFAPRLTDVICENVNGLVVQLVRIHACHAWGRGFESRPDREKPLVFSEGLFLCLFVSLGSGLVVAVWNCLGYFDIVWDCLVWFEMSGGGCK